jgi:hypothetical protein
MPRIDNVQGELGFESGKQEWYVATCRPNLISAMGAGLFRPIQALVKPYEDFISKTPGCVPLIRREWSGEAAKLSDSGERGRFPVLVEVDIKRLVGVKAAICNSRWNWKVEDLKGKALSSAKAVLCRSIPLGYGTKIHFRDQIELDEFRSKGFSNVDYDVLPMEVSPELFQCKEGGDSKFADAISKVPDLGPLPEGLFRLLDCLAGVVAVVCKHIPSEKEWVEAFATGLSDSLRGSTCNADLTSLLSTFSEAFCSSLKKTSVHFLEDSESVFVEALIKAAEAGGVQSGIVPGDFIEELATRASGKVDDPNFAKWVQVSKELFAGMREPEGLLSDEGSIYKRGAMLFALRKNLDGIVGPKSAAVSGEQVRAIATMIWGCYAGFESLDKDLKTENVSRACQELVMELLAKAVESKTRRKARVEVKLDSRERDFLFDDVQITVNDRLLGEWLVGPGIALKRAASIAEGAGEKMRYDRRSKRLECDLSIGEGQAQEVWVVDGGAGWNDRPTLRFMSRCEDLSTAAARKKLTKTKLYDLLKRNSGTGQKCRFAIDESRMALVVVVDQLLDTLDIAEFKAHLAEVARVAGSYNNGLSGSGL